MNSYFKALIRGALAMVMVVPVLIVPFIINDAYSLPKAILVRLIFVVVIAAWLALIASSGRLQVARIGIHPVIIAFAFILILTTIMSATGAVGFFGNYLRYEGLLTWVAYLTIFIAAVTYIDKTTVERLLRLGLPVAAPIALYAIAQFLGLDPLPAGTWADLRRTASTLGNPVYLGAYLVLVIPLVLSLVLKTKTSYKYWYGTLLVLLAVALVTTYARGAWLGAAVAVIVFLGIVHRQIEPKNWFLIFSSFLVVVAVVAGLLLSKPDKSYLMPRLSSSFDLSGGSVGSRLDLWRAGVSVIKKRPLLGWGLETFGDVVWSERPSTSGSRPPRADRPHNQLLYLASALGLLGLAVYIYLIIVILKRIYQAAIRGATAGDRLLAAGILAACLGYIIQEQFSFSQVETAPLFWLLMGFGVTLSSRPLSFVTYDFRRRPVALALGTVVISIVLLILTLANISFLAADYRYAAYVKGRAGATALTGAIMLNPYENLYRNALGSYFMDIGRLNKNNEALARAAAEFEKALLVNGRDKVVAINLAKTYSLLAETNGRYIDNAITAHMRVLKIDPLYFPSQRAMAILYIWNEDGDAAIVYLRKWLAIEPHDGQALFLAGLASEYRGRSAAANNYLRRAAQTDSPFAAQAAARLKAK